MKTVYVEGEGILTEDGHFFTEAQCRAALDAVAALWRWWQTLSEPLQAQLQAAAVETERQRAMQGGR